MLRSLILVAVASSVYVIQSSRANEDCQCTGANEVYVKCPGCSPQTCDTIGKAYSCPAMTADNCKGACRCITDYYRNEDNECIPEDQCPNSCTGANEVYDNCPDCSPQTCDSIGKIYDCPLETADNCEPACRCKTGYYRNSDDECIPANECSCS